MLSYCISHFEIDLNEMQFGLLIYDGLGDGLSVVWIHSFVLVYVLNCSLMRVTGGGFGGKETRNIWLSTVTAVAANK